MRVFLARLGSPVNLARRALGLPSPGVFYFLFDIASLHKTELFICIEALRIYDFQAFLIASSGGDDCNARLIHDRSKIESNMHRLCNLLWYQFW